MCDMDIPDDDELDELDGGGGVRVTVADGADGGRAARIDVVVWPGPPSVMGMPCSQSGSKAIV